MGSVVSQPVCQLLVHATPAPARHLLAAHGRENAYGGGGEVRTLGRAVCGGVAFACVLLLAWALFGVRVEWPDLVTVIVACAASDAVREAMR